MIDLTNPLYKSVIEPIMERIMEANEIGREYAERYIHDTVENALSEQQQDIEYEIYRAIDTAVYEYESRICQLESEIQSLSQTVLALADANLRSKSWFDRLLGR